MIVIDTQALVWMAQGDRRLGKDAEAAIMDARGGGGVVIPAIMTWEVAMLVDKRRLELPVEPLQWFDLVFGQTGFVLAAQSVEIGIDAGTLPGSIHGDPADRLMIATARALDLPLLTADAKILRYAGAGHCRAIDARI